MQVLLTGSDARVLREVEERLRSHGCRVVRERTGGHDLVVRVEAGPWASLEPVAGDGTPSLLITDREEPHRLAALAVAGHLDFLLWPRDEAWLGARLAVLRARLAEADQLRRGFAEALREAEERFQLLFDNQFLAISLYDLDEGHFLEVNDAWLRLHGYERKEALRLSPAAVMAEPSAPLESDGTFRWHRRKDGSVFPVELHAGSLTWFGRRLVATVVHDISERRRLETRQAGRAHVASRPERAAAEEATSAQAKPRLLVVDDEPMILNLAVRLLRDRLEVVAVASADEALALVGVGKAFDAALIDVMLPGASGIDLYAALERKAPNLAARAGFMTGGTFTERARLFLESHPHRVLEKPFGSAALVGFVSSLLD